MPGREERPEGRLREAQEVYTAYLQRLEEGRHSDFNEFCSDHSALNPFLRSIHECVQRGQALAASRSFHRSLEERFGELDEITISLEAGSKLIDVFLVASGTGHGLSSLKVR